MLFAFNPQRISINPKFLKIMSSTATIIIAEYAKSGKSTCKKCSEKIDSKSLRLGLKFHDPRGYDSTKWHHLNCFFSSDSGSVSSVETIEGFSELTGGDQDKLKQIVSEGHQSSSTKRQGDDETDPDQRGSKKLKETDVNEEIGQEKHNVPNEKIVAEYAKSGRSSCKKCSEKIETKSLRLGFSSHDPRGFENTKWHHLDCFFLLDTDLVSVESIQGFSELRSGDQEKLKTLVRESGQSSEKLNEDCKTGPHGEDQKKEKREADDETDPDRRDSKKLKETDVNEETWKKKQNVPNEKIVAEYAKSGRSSCKKCSEKIETKSLRLGFSSHDPRGFENTKWHHLDCFFLLDADLVSVESIQGFSELKSDDQEKLKKLVSKRGQSSEK